MRTKLLAVYLVILSLGPGVISAQPVLQFEFSNYRVAEDGDRRRHQVIFSSGSSTSTTSYLSIIGMRTPSSSVFHISPS